MPPGRLSQRQVQCPFCIPSANQLNINFLLHFLVRELLKSNLYRLIHFFFSHSLSFLHFLFIVLLPSSSILYFFFPFVISLVFLYLFPYVLRFFCFFFFICIFTGFLFLVWSDSVGPVCAEFPHETLVSKR